MRDFVLHTGTGRAPWLVFFVAGVALMIFGLLIVLLPALLELLVAAVCISIGAALAAIGWRLRQSRGAAGGIGGPWSRLFDPPR